MVAVRFQWKKITAGSLDAKKMSTLANGDGHYTNIVLQVLWYVYNSISSPKPYDSNSDTLVNRVQKNMSDTNHN